MWFEPWAYRTEFDGVGCEVDDSMVFLMQGKDVKTIQCEKMIRFQHRLSQVTN